MLRLPSNFNFKKMSLVAGIAALATLVVVVGIISIPLTIANPQSSDISSIDAKYQVDLYFNICGEEKDPKAVSGTPENPITLKRGLGQVTVPFCILNVSPEPRTWKLVAGDSDNISLNPRHGIKASFDNNFLILPARVEEEMHYHDGKGNAPDFIVHVSADNNAELGMHSFAVESLYPTGNVTLVKGYVVYVNVTQ